MESALVNERRSALAVLEFVENVLLLARRLDLLGLSAFCEILLTVLVVHQSAQQVSGHGQRPSVRQKHSIFWLFLLRI
jgi:hypothetical protein